MPRRRQRPTTAEQHLERQNRAYERGHAQLRELYAAADKVLQERGLERNQANRAQVINESDKRV